jgi:hypothetical protein
MINRGFALTMVALTAAGCSSSGSPYGGGPDAASGKTVVVNEVFPSGASPAMPDWIELKNLTGAAVDLGGYQVRDNLVADLYALPAGTSIAAGGYLVIYCDDQADGGVAGGVHVPWKLSASKGDEVHLLDAAGVEVDATIFGTDLSTGKAWGRLPDGTGAFTRTTPTEGKANL